MPFFCKFLSFTNRISPTLLPYRALLWYRKTWKSGKNKHNILGKTAKKKYICLGKVAKQ